MSSSSYIPIFEDGYEYAKEMRLLEHKKLESFANIHQLDKRKRMRLFSNLPTLEESNKLKKLKMESPLSDSSFFEGGQFLCSLFWG
jgi:hypothetical protein